MTISVTISLGHLTIPLIITHSVKSLETTSAEEEDEITTISPQWTFGTTICISSFVQSPPNIYPTIEKHVLTLDPHANAVEKETLSILSRTCATACHGLAILNKDVLGILSATTTSHTWTLQIVQYDTSIKQSTIKSYAATTIQQQVLDMDQSAKPYEMMELCQLWPTSQPQLSKLAKQIYATCSLYGYWDYWRVFEGICQGHHIQSQQLLN